MIRFDDYTERDEDQQRNDDDPHLNSETSGEIRRRIASGFYEQRAIETELARKLILSWRSSE